ncbi:MAG: hypothetical protein WC460_00060 [Patescibacteria group bacterium]
MEIEVDYNPSPSKMFFISVELNKKEAISFDYTFKGHRVLKQILVEKKKMPKEIKFTSEWDALIIINKKLIKKYHIRWVDLDKKDWVNDDIWKAHNPKPISEGLKDKLLHYSQLISDNYKHLDKFQKDLTDFENLLAEEIAKYLKYEEQ